jgi:uncharacterized protein YecE (DUF72 family)
MHPFMAGVTWHIGCSGFHYKEWREAFYPKGLAQKNWFDYYTNHFNTLELNVTFYRFPTLPSLRTWHEKAPEGFLFSSKVPRAITHFKKFVETERLLADFYGTLQEGLSDKLGCVLFQLPPQFTYSEANLQKLLAQIDPGFNNVIEFRHDSWWRPDVESALTRQNIIFCGVSFPKVSFDDAVVNLPRCYYRFHGVPRLFYSEYDNSFLNRIYSQIHGNGALKEAYIYFNNTASMAALHNAKFFQTLANGSNH